jgi:hypothetical protein
MEFEFNNIELPFGCRTETGGKGGVEVLGALFIHPLDSKKSNILLVLFTSNIIRICQNIKQINIPILINCLAIAFLR